MESVEWPKASVGFAMPALPAETASSTCIPCLGNDPTCSRLQPTLCRFRVPLYVCVPRQMWNLQLGRLASQAPVRPRTSRLAPSCSWCRGGAGREPDRSTVFTAHRVLSDTCVGLRSEPSGSKGRSLSWEWQWSQRIIRTSSQGEKSHRHFWRLQGSELERGCWWEQWGVGTGSPKLKNTQASTAARSASARPLLCSLPLSAGPIHVTDSCWGAWWGQWSWGAMLFEALLAFC